METAVSWEMTTCSLVEVSNYFAGMWFLHLQRRHFCSLKMEGGSFKSSKNIFQTTWHQIPEDNLHISVIFFY
jgi:hypothetical protein